jgi:nucleotide-binding universal stress UspA family protein
VISYATLMVHVHPEGELSGRVRVAGELAERFRAHLVGVAAWAPMTLFQSEETLTRSLPTQPHLQDMMSLLDLKGREFRAAVENGGRRAEWRSVLDLPNEVVAREARAADLVIIGNARESKNPFLALDPGSLLLRVGRPVLVVPKPVNSLVPRRIAIAWKDVREARRAVQDALPFLRQAESVMIVEVSEGDEITQPLHRVKDVAAYLKRHRVEIITERVRPDEVGAANSLLQFIHDENINLLVAGAYGHSRLGEWAFGGATRDLLTESPICSLFSH